jgi:hypothetical protein
MYPTMIGLKTSVGLFTLVVFKKILTNVYGPDLLGCNFIQQWLD